MSWMDEVLEWMAIHPIVVDFLVVASVTGTVAYILRCTRRHRRVLHRRMWAMHLKRKDLERYHLMKFEDALTDAAFEMVQRGEMTEKQERLWYAFFAEQYNMLGVMPIRDQASTKRGIKARMSMWWGKIKPDIPGPKPGVKVDETYKPKNDPVMKSKYVR